jgi:hypothetical protein
VSESRSDVVLGHLTAKSIPEIQGIDALAVASLLLQTPCGAGMIVTRATVHAETVGSPM